jgi:hypothetical protein
MLCALQYCTVGRDIYVRAVSQLVHHTPAVNNSITYLYIIRLTKMVDKVLKYMGISDDIISNNPPPLPFFADKILLCYLYSANYLHYWKL